MLNILKHTFEVSLAGWEAIEAHVVFLGATLAAFVLISFIGSLVRLSNLDECPSAFWFIFKKIPINFVLNSNERKFPWRHSAHTV